MIKASQAKNVLMDYVERHRALKKYKLPSERVLANELGYSRGTIGKALGVLEGEGVIERKHGSGTFITPNGQKHTIKIAVVMRNAYQCTDSHFRFIVEQISKYAEENNIYIQIFDRVKDMFDIRSEYNPLTEAIRNRIIDGTLVVSRVPLSIISRISSISPTVSINNTFGDGHEVPCISCDYFRSGFLAGKYLLEKGHRKIAFITTNREHPESELDFSGLSCALEMANIKLSEDDVLETGYNQNTFSARTVKFFSSGKYTACFIRNSLNATRVQSLLQNKLLNTPDGLTIVANGNYKSNIGVNNSQRIIIVDNRLDEMCKLGLEILTRRIMGKEHFCGLKLVLPKLAELS